VLDTLASLSGKQLDYHRKTCLAELMRLAEKKQAGPGTHEEP